VRRARRYDLGGGRGLVRYGPPLHCTYGTEITVQTSSAAMGRHAWLRLEQDASCLKSGNASAHLNEQQVRELIRRLQTWLEDPKA
jgi:hypothetical protein